MSNKKEESIFSIPHVPSVTTTSDQPVPTSGMLKLGGVFDGVQKLAHETVHGDGQRE